MTAPAASQYFRLVVGVASAPVVLGLLTVAMMGFFTGLLILASR